jgi:hypothetical protein
MISPAGGERSPAIRDEVYRLWQAADRTRFLLRLGATSGAVMLAALAFAYVLVDLAQVPLMLVAIALIMFGASLLVISAGAFAGGSLAAAYRGHRRRQLRRRLERLPLDERRQALLSLQRDPVPNTERIVHDLIRQLRLEATEVTAAAPRAGEGTEVTPGEAAEHAAPGLGSPAGERRA